MPQQSTSDAIAKLLQRQPQHPWNSLDNNKRLLVVNPDGDGLTFLTGDAWCFHAGHASFWQDAYCQALPPQLDAYGGVVFVVAKEQPLNQYILRCLAALPAQTPLWLAGEKRGGINTLVNRLPDNFCPAQKLAVGNHCQLFKTEILTSTTPLTDLTDLIALADDITVTLPERKFSLKSLPGVFSRQRIDAGTQLLLEALPQQLPTPVLDFACGNGVIARTLHERQHPLLYACDVNPLATAAAAINLSGANAEIFLADGLPEIPQTVGCIVSNPPFHTGLKTDYTIAHNFIAAAYKQLKHGGELYLVANNFLPWPKAIERTFGHCKRLIHNKRFTVYYAQRN
jgi:16S rRNA (guanine1207-N2)-methyltransferase